MIIHQILNNINLTHQDIIWFLCWLIYETFYLLLRRQPQYLYYPFVLQILILKLKVQCELHLIFTYQVCIFSQGKFLHFLLLSLLQQLSNYRTLLMGLIESNVVLRHHNQPPKLKFRKVDNLLIGFFLELTQKFLCKVFELQ